MTPHQFELPVADATPAILTLPQPLTARTLQALETALVANLAMLRRDLCGVNEAAGRADDADVTETAGELEYRSWMPDAGALEYASWTAHLPTSRR
ncbi:MAG: hypothetical protein ACOYLV_14785 [Rubrivivax sp.]